MSDLAKFAASCKQLGAELERARVRGTRNAALAVASRVRAETAKAAPAGVLSGVGKAGAVVGVKAEPIRGDGMIVKVTGPYQLIERDTAEHLEPRPSKLGKTALNIPGVGYRRFAKHPGTKGKHPFERAVDGAASSVPAEYQKEVQAAVQRAFQ